MFNWLALLIAYLPFQIALNPKVGFDLASLRILIICLFIIYLGKIYQERLKIYNFQAISLFLFLVLSAFSLIGAENVSWGLRKIVFFISIFPLYFLVVVLINNWTKIRGIVQILFLGSALLALIGLIQFLAQFIFGLGRVAGFWAVNVLPVFSGFNLGAMILAYPSWLARVNGQTIMRAFSLFSDPHMFSFYLGLTLPLIIVFLKNKVAKLLIGSYLLIFITLLLTFTRGAYLAVIISSLVTSTLLWLFCRRKRLALLLLIPLLFLIIPGTPVSDRFYSSFDLAEGSNLGRLAMWRQAGQAGFDNFWTGLGLGNYSLEVDFSLGYRNPITAHNFYLDLFSEMGVFALTLWLVLILGTIAYLFLAVKNSQDNNKKYLAVALIGSLTYFLTHSFFETAIYSPPVLALLMVILGLSTIVIGNKIKIRSF